MRQLVEAHDLSSRTRPEPAQVVWCLANLGTGALLVEIASRDPDAASAVAERRAATTRAIEGGVPPIEYALIEEGSARNVCAKVFPFV